eukprot:g2678.t1
MHAACNKIELSSYHAMAQASMSTSTAAEGASSSATHEFVLQRTAFFLDGASISRFTCCCHAARRVLGAQELLRWVAAVRHGALPRLRCAEQLEIAESLRDIDSTLDFAWGSTSVANEAKPALRRLRHLLTRHPQLRVRVEGHAAIEAPTHIAVPFSTERAASVARFLCWDDLEMDSADALPPPPPALDPDRIDVVGRGKSRALVASAGYMRQERGGDRNRRAEIFVLLDGTEFPGSAEAEGAPAATVVDCSEGGVILEAGVMAAEVGSVKAGAGAGEAGSMGGSMVGGAGAGAGADAGADDNEGGTPDTLFDFSRVEGEQMMLDSLAFVPGGPNVGVGGFMFEDDVSDSQAGESSSEDSGDG